MKKLDLHGVKYKDAPNSIDTFIRHNKNSLPVEIITGNSYEMKEFLGNIVKRYNLRMNSKSISNLGAFIINNKF